MSSSPQSPTQNSTLHLLPGTPRDIPHIIRLQNLAFAPNPVRHLIWPGGMPSSTFFEYLARHQRSLAEDPNFYIMKVVAIEGKKEGKESDDEIGGKLVGSALWRLTPGKTEEEWDREDRGGSVECGEKMSPRPEVFNEIERGLQAVRRRVRRDQMFWELIHLDTHPDYQRRGIGSMLVQWGVDKSNESGIPAYLESTEIGSPLYMKFGFKEVDRLTLAMSKWAEFGGQGSYSYVYMVRWPDSQELN